MKAHLQPSKQDRSRATQDRILKATTRLLRGAAFDAISIRRIVDEANTSIGSFYARFRDKDALLTVLYELQEDRLEKQIAMLKKDAANASSIAELSALIAAHFVARYGKNPNLSRALFERETRSPHSDEASALSSKRRVQYGFLVDELLKYQGDITHPSPDQAVELGLYFLTVACRNRLFYPLAPQSRTLKTSTKQLTQELARLLSSYLTG